jgi:3-oxoacyl-[acyl-carrier protein] reductase
MNAIVTGATKGIGRAVVWHLAANNYHVVLCARNQKELDKLLVELRETYPKLSFFGLKADMEYISEVKAFAHFSLKSLGSVDVLVNNAGLYIPSELLLEDELSLERQMKVNVYAPHLLSKYCAEKMKLTNSGHIINICSMASIDPVLSAGSYSISKAALLSLTKVLRNELMPFGIKVTAVLPGATLTDSWSGTTLPSERFVSADDVALSIINCLQMSAGANIDEVIIRPLKGEI